jgi:hypothetical protein
LLTITGDSITYCTHASWVSWQTSSSGGFRRLFARLLNVSSNAVESWEQGIREPRQATLKLLHIAKKNPGVLLD